MADFQIKRNDLEPSIYGTLYNADGTLVNLTGKTVTFVMRNRGGASAKVNAAATIVSASGGEVRYDWTGTDTDTSGSYLAEWQTTSSGRSQTYPNAGYITIDIIDDLG